MIKVLFGELKDSENRAVLVEMAKINISNMNGKSKCLIPEGKEEEYPTLHLMTQLEDSVTKILGHPRNMNISNEVYKKMFDCV